MSFGVYRYEHTEFGPIMLLLDSETDQRNASVDAQGNGRYKNGKPLEDSIDFDKRPIQKTSRGKSYRVSPMGHYKSNQKEKFGPQKKSLEKIKKAEEKSIQLPMIPKGKKKKIDL